MIDILKAAPRWFMVVMVAGSTAFGAWAGTIAGMVIVDSLARIERYNRDEWQKQMAEQAYRIGAAESSIRQHGEEFTRRAKADAEFKEEMRREFDRLNFRLTQKGR